MNHKINRILQGIFWILVYLFLTLLPVLVMFLPPRPPGREFIREFSVALGFVGLAMMALQFALTARFKTIKSPLWCGCGLPLSPANFNTGIYSYCYPPDFALCPADSSNQHFEYFFTRNTVAGSFCSYFADCAFSLDRDGFMA